MTIPSDSTEAIINGLEMSMITQKQRGDLLISDPDCTRVHEIILKNGVFLFEENEEGRLENFYKVICPE